jgi:hypothetical protein
VVIHSIIVFVDKRLSTCDREQRSLLSNGSTICHGERLSREITETDTKEMLGVGSSFCAVSLTFLGLSRTGLS